MCIDFSEILGFTLVLIAISFQSPLDVHQAASLEIFLADFSQSAPGFHVDPFGVFFGFTFGFPAVAHRYAESGHLFYRLGYSDSPDPSPDIQSIEHG